MATDFHGIHLRRYGFSRESRPVQVVNVRVRMVAPAPPFAQTPEPLGQGDGAQALMSTRSAWFDGGFVDTRIYSRDRLSPGDCFIGPAVVSEYSSATVLPPGDTLRVDGLRNLVIEVTP
jgi:N-methylhydantoinase A